MNRKWKITFGVIVLLAAACLSVWMIRHSTDNEQPSSHHHHHVG